MRYLRIRARNLSSFARSHCNAKVAVPGARRRVFYFGEHKTPEDGADRQAARFWVVLKPSANNDAVDKSRQTSSRDPGAFRWNRKKTFFDNRKAGKSTPITLFLITVGKGAMVWIITSSARVEQYCGKIYKANSANSDLVSSSPSSVQGVVPCNVSLRRFGTWFRPPNKAKSKARPAVYPTAESGMYGVAVVRCVFFVQTVWTSWVSFMIKLLRAYGGCLGARRR